MKFTNNKKWKDKWKKTLSLLGILCLVMALGITALVFLHRSKEKDLSFPYNVSDELYGTHGAEVQMQKAVSYAENLCVSSGNIGCEGISVSQSTKAALFNVENSSVEFAQNIHEKSYPASITKVMTAMVALKYGNLEDIVTISENAVGLEDGSTEIGMAPGDQVSLYELLHGLLIYSGNDAAMAIAEHVGGSVENFVSMMNEEAQEIGATNTHFMNPSGLHDENHYTTVYDIYLMMTEALKYPVFEEIIQLSSYNMTYTRGEETLVKHLDSTDQYLTKLVTPPKNVTILGGKTGTTSDAGSCLALVSQNAYGELFISIVLHASTKSTLYDNMNQLLSQINS